MKAYESVVFVGDHPLVVSCAGRLAEAGLQVLGVSTEEASIADWARGSGIELVAWDALSPFLADRRPDVLLSVGNLRIVPDDMVASVRLAVNFHDGPLPAFAGLHVPMWAILANAERHGVAWHVIEAGVDEGDVLAGAEFAITDDETTRSINLKCLAAAGDSFELLAEQLADGELVRIPQVGSGQMFGRYDRPSPAGAVVPHAMAAAEIDRLVRALDFGPTRNRVGRPLLALTPSSVMVVGSAEILDRDSDRVPGAVLELERVGTRLVVTVTTTTQPIRLSGWAEDDASIDALTGSVLPDPTGSLAALASLQSEVVRNEVWWSRRLAVTRVDVDGVDPEASNWSKSAPRSVVGSLEHVGALAALFVLARTDQWAGSIGIATSAAVDATVQPWFQTIVPVSVTVEPAISASEAIVAVSDALSEARRRGPHLRDLAVRMPVQVDGPPVLEIPTVVVIPEGVSCDAPLAFIVGDGSVRLRARGSAAEALAEGFAAFVAATAGGETSVGALPVIGDADVAQVVALGGAPAAQSFRGALHDQFLAVAAAMPDATAVVHREHEISFGELEVRARRVARYLIDAGVVPGSFVGVSTAPGIDMVTAILGVLLTGAAYVPLDPRFPLERLTFMAADAALTIVLSDDPANLPVRGPRAVDIALVASDVTIAPATNLPTVGADELAYLMYTSGSTGLPKGVKVNHGNVDGFLASMEPHVGVDAGVWLSVTTLSFDISVLELFYPLIHGWTIVLYEGLAALRPRTEAGRANTRLDMSLFFFASEGDEGGGQYEVLLDAARFADTHGFAAVWTPERHFNTFGGPFPNPSVTGAALAVVTKNVAIRAGSCVLPLHHPARVAEEWAVVDRFSGGRVALSIAAGWHPEDFVLRPQNFGQSKDALVAQIDELRALWRGEAVLYPGPKGDVSVTTLPRPIQPELPIWYTTAGNIESFELAGRQGYNLLTHLLGQSIDELTAKVAAYRQAWNDAGHDGEGTVSLMIHTFVADDRDQVREIVREPMKGYLHDSISLVKAHASSFPTFDPTATDTDGLLMGLTPEDLDALLEVSFARYFETSGLFGSVDECVEIAERIAATGVNEIAALVDFGIDGQTVLAHLKQLDEVRQRFVVPAASSRVDTYGSLIEAHGVTHLQCTPSEARIVLADDHSRLALGQLEHMLVGGEACPISVATELFDAVGGTLVNVYGPTETTIWSTAHTVTRNDLSSGALPIGRPLANTTVRITGSGGALRPPGQIGELLIGGHGVTAGYHGRPELTAERFVDRPDTVGKVYRTGDLAVLHADGTLGFFGRADSQVKIRGHRIELGEIEAALERRNDVNEAVVVVHGEAEAASLVGHIVGADIHDRDSSVLIADLRTHLPEHMVPDRYIWHDALPTTPNGKVDRLTLATAAPTVVRAAEPIATRSEPSRVAPPRSTVDASELASLIEMAWSETLKVATIDRNRSFFDHGGNSLQALALREMMENKLGRPVSLVDLFRYTTVNGLADALAAAGASHASDLEAPDDPMGRGDGVTRRPVTRRRGRRGRP